VRFVKLIVALKPFGDGRDVKRVHSDFHRNVVDLLIANGVVEVPVCL
jgi:hypothetical protein